MAKTGTADAAEEVYRFARGGKEAPSLADDPLFALVAYCIAEQQRAGFGTHLDARRFPCYGCGVPGINTGWGYVKHTCGAEVLSDGTIDEPCPKAEADTAYAVADAMPRALSAKAEG